MGGAMKAIGGLAKKALPMVGNMISGGGGDKEEGGGGGGGGMFGSLLKSGLGMLSAKDEDGKSGFESAGGAIGGLFGGKGAGVGSILGKGASSLFDMFSGPQEDAA